MAFQHFGLWYQIYFCTTINVFFSKLEKSLSCLFPAPRTATMNAYLALWTATEATSTSGPWTEMLCVSQRRYSVLELRHAIKALSFSAMKRPLLLQVTYVPSPQMNTQLSTRYRSIWKYVKPMDKYQDMKVSQLLVPNINFMGRKKRRKGQRMTEMVFNCNHSKRRRLSHRTVRWAHLFSTTDSYFVLKRLHISAPSTLHLFLDASLCVTCKMYVW